MGLHWLKIDRPCILEVPQLKDYAGQALIFRPPALLTRCVTSEVFNHPLVKAYRDQLLLVEVAGNGAVLAPAAAPTVEVVKIAPEFISTPAVVEPEAPAAVVVPEPEAPPAPAVVEPEPVVVAEVPASEEPASDSVSADEGSSTSNDDGKGFEVKRRRR